MLCREEFSNYAPHKWSVWWMTRRDGRKFSHRFTYFYHRKFMRELYKNLTFSCRQPTCQSALVIKEGAPQLCKAHRRRLLCHRQFNKLPTNHPSESFDVTMEPDWNPIPSLIAELNRPWQLGIVRAQRVAWEGGSRLWKCKSQTKLTEIEKISEAKSAAWCIDNKSQILRV